MNGIRTFTIRQTCVLFLATAGALAATPEYFPLQSGNSWAYRVTQANRSRPGTINVGGTVSLDGRQYFSVQFFDRDVLVRQGEDGSILEWNPDTKSESTWLAFGAPDKQNVQTTFDACARAAWVESRNARIKTDLGDLNNALEVRYVNNCADAGATVQFFVPYVGLVHYESSSITGPVVYELIYSRTGMTNIDTKVNAFTVAVDSQTYKAGQTEEALARVTLRANEPVKVTFPSGQSTDLRITSANGDSVYVWSADKLFAQIVREEQVGPGEKTWLMSFPVGQLAPGKYTAEAWLTTNPRQYSGNVSFEVK